MNLYLLFVKGENAWHMEDISSHVTKTDQDSTPRLLSESNHQRVYSFVADSGKEAFSIAKEFVQDKTELCVGDKVVNMDGENGVVTGVDQEGWMVIAHEDGWEDSTTIDGRIHVTSGAPFWKKI